MTRRRVLADAAERIVRSALAVRPCLPITLPRSSSATLQLEDERVRLGDLLDLDLFGVVDETARQIVDQLTQRRLSRLAELRSDDLCRRRRSCVPTTRRLRRRGGGAARRCRRSSSPTVWLGSAPTESQCSRRSSSTRNSTGSRSGIVDAELLDESTVARAAPIGGDDAVEGNLLAASAGQIE